METTGLIQEIACKNHCMLVMVFLLTKLCEVFAVLRMDAGTTTNVIFDLWISRFLGAVSDLLGPRGKFQKLSYARVL